MEYAWTVARVLDDGSREDANPLLASTDTTQSALAFTPTTAAGWASDTSYEFTLTVSRGTRSAAYSVLVSVSSDQYMPRATITGFDESVKYNPTEGAFTAIYFKATSPDSARTIEQTAWSVGDGQSAGLLGKPSGAPSPMLVDLGKTRPNAVYRLKLTVTDSIGSTSSTVVSLIFMNSRSSIALTASGFLIAWNLVATDISANCSLVVPNSCICRCATIA